LYTAESFTRAASDLLVFEDKAAKLGFNTLFNNIYPSRWISLCRVHVSADCGCHLSSWGTLFSRNCDHFPRIDVLQTFRAENVRLEAFSSSDLHDRAIFGWLDSWSDIIFKFNPFYGY